MSHVELGVCEVVGVLTQPFDVIASLLAGPAAVTVAVLEPEVRPVAAAVRVQEPGTPVMLRVVVVFVPLTAIVPEVGETLQTLALSTDHVTVVLVPLVVVTVLPSASWTVTVIVEVAVEEPAASEVGLAEQASFAGAPTEGTDTSW